MHDRLVMYKKWHYLYMIKRSVYKHPPRRPTVTGYLETLVKQDVLKSIKIGRENYYINHKLMDFLTKP